MDTQKLKLAIIQRVTSCEDQQLLQTIYQLLERLDKKANLSEEYNHELISAILGETTGKSLTNKGETSQSDIDELQRSIDDVFGP